MAAKNTLLSTTLESPIPAIRNIKWTAIRPGKCTEAQCVAMSEKVMVVKLDDTTFATNVLSKHGIGSTAVGSVVKIYENPMAPKIKNLLRCLVFMSVITKAQHEKHEKAGIASWKRRSKEQSQKNGGHFAYVQGYWTWIKTPTKAKTTKAKTTKASRASSV